MSEKIENLIAKLAKIDRAMIKLQDRRDEVQQALCHVQGLRCFCRCGDRICMPEEVKLEWEERP